MAAIRKGAIVIQQANVPSKDIDNELILLDLSSGDYFALNETGRMIWKLLNGRNTVEGIARRIASAFDIGRADAFSEASAFIKVLVRKKLAKVVQTG